MEQTPHVVRLYESTIPSGNAYKVSLLLAHLGRPVEVVELDILATPPETRRPEFLAKNPNGYCGLGGTGVACPVGLAAAE